MAASDPGTHGATGHCKKRTSSSRSLKELRKALEATGHRYRVQLTRDSDVFIPLRERGEYCACREMEICLFPCMPRFQRTITEIRGASVYTLSEDGSDREAIKLAEKENMSDVIAGVDLTGENSQVSSMPDRPSAA